MATGKNNPFRNKRVKKESHVERYLTPQVQLAGGEVRKLAFIGRRGAPDRVVMLPGVLVFVELKSTVGKLHPAQEREHARLKAMSQQVVTIREEWEVDFFLGSWIKMSEQGKKDLAC